jgi:hypothetical protein
MNSPKELMDDYITRVFPEGLSKAEKYNIEQTFLSGMFIMLTEIVSLEKSNDIEILLDNFTDSLLDDMNNYLPKNSLLKKYKNFQQHN